LRRVAKATGAAIQTSVHNISENLLGKCALFEEKQVGSQRYNFFTGCEHTRTATIILRGGGEHFIDEAERSLHDSIMIVRRTMKHKHIVAGGGAVEMEISNHLNEFSSKIPGKGQIIIKGRVFYF
jgi:T-complex protein 1 subunit eta